ncbi:MAG TPA: hypothetical protein VH593_22645, partial [Ktedonobacteraceae bacterium]
MCASPQVNNTDPEQDKPAQRPHILLVVVKRLFVSIQIGSSVLLAIQQPAHLPVHKRLRRFTEFLVLWLG